MAQNDETQRPRRLRDAVFTTVIGPGTSIRGEISGEDAVDLAGSLEGDAQVSAHFRVRKGGRVAGAIEAQGLIVDGTVEGPRIAAERIEVGESARVKAGLRAQVIAIAEGAVFDGSVDMQGEEAADGPRYFKEQRQPR
jgi:cytoskeletal protein CcmA (bactofilin family)